MTDELESDYGLAQLAMPTRPADIIYNAQNTARTWCPLGFYVDFSSTAIRLPVNRAILSSPAWANLL